LKKETVFEVVLSCSVSISESNDDLVLVNDMGNVVARDSMNDFPINMNNHCLEDVVVDDDDDVDDNDDVNELDDDEPDNA
jgi:hypothetical protein